ncbi:hypothetical protein BB559_002177 [Furculomyces boomerangus]|uniref:N-acyl-aliphatic-L-amino acid amidohydrolase n=1 Tax=Furculomyces boomerangus TaxID=61424 RepID=A0A2T9YXD8_9FUNG|nr:hypothetical protein BB559_002177 [Furculomyces boomerangus]
MTITESPEVTRFCQYLQIKTIQPTPDYAACTQFLVNQAKEIGLEYQVVEPVEGKPSVILKLAGKDPSLKSILFNSHTDVVPVYRESWNYDPFAAERVQMEDGSYRIYARGSQDMKVTGSMYLEAMRRIKESGRQPLRNVYALFVPDEEIGGAEGMRALVETQEFKDLNACFDIDEGAISSTEKSFYFASERVSCHATFTAHGNTGHGSGFVQGTAIGKLLPIINELMEYRQSQLDELTAMSGAPMLNSGHFTTVNLTMLEGGKQANVVPATYSATFDIRITPNRDHLEYYKYLEDLAAKHDCEIDIPRREKANLATKLDASNRFMKAFLDTCDSQKRVPMEVIMPATTDARYVRQAGIPAVGFNPMRNHKSLAHNHDEYVVESEFLEGIPFYVELMLSLGNVEEIVDYKSSPL